MVYLARDAGLRGITRTRYHAGSPQHPLQPWHGARHRWRGPLCRGCLNFAQCPAASRRLNPHQRHTSGLGSTVSPAREVLAYALASNPHARGAGLSPGPAPGDVWYLPAIPCANTALHNFRVRLTPWRPMV